MIFKILFIPRRETTKILKSKLDNFFKAKILAVINRINTLAIIKRAGSGHVGTSFSAMDIFTWVKYFSFVTLKKDLKKEERNIFFSSKGHDVPALYSILYSLKIISLDKILKLRRISGLDGHPDISIPGIEANTGSLGMGISKAKGIVWSKRYLKKKGQVIVLIGDGEFQEGQIFEALQTTAHQKLNEVIVIMDHNKIQSSQYVSKIINLRDLEKKISSFGWHVERCNGHSFKEINKVFKKFIKIKNKPKFLIADTIKGKGVSFMEHPKVMKKSSLYNWHAGAPGDIDFVTAQEELLKKLNSLLTLKKLKSLKTLDIYKNQKINFQSLEIH
jgi:transketolase